MKLLELIKAAIARLADLTQDELSELKANILKCSEEFSGDTAEDAKVLTELGGYAESVMERSAAIDAETAKTAEAAKAARDRIAALNGEVVSDEEVVEGTEGAEIIPITGEVDPALEAIAASGKTTPRSGPSKMRSFSNASRSPELAGDGPKRPSLVAASQLIDHTFGDEIEDKYALGKEMSAILSGLDPRGRNGRVVVARGRWDDLYPEERRLSGFSTDEDFRKMDALTGRTSKRGAIVASGGVPLPTNVDYSMDVWATADRPIRDGLVAFHVDRGGLLYRQPPTLASLSGASAVWTNANDINPTSPTTKPVHTVVAQGTTQVFINAIPTRLQFGNLMGQFDPETIAANTDLAIANAAQVAELELWSNIQGFTTAETQWTSAKLLGASRDLFGTLVQACAAYRFTYRLNRDQMLTVIFPSWGLDLIKHDRLLELGHDDSGTNVFAITDEEVTSWFANQNVDVIWSLDGLAANAGAGTYAAQTFPAFAAGAVPVYPAVVMWNIFIKGSIQFLDGGRLDLGVVRDSTLDATNDYETFVEPFENVANRGFVGNVVQVVSTTHAIGATSATVTVS